MIRHSSENEPPEADFFNIRNEHRRLRILIGKLECSRTSHERLGLLEQFNDAFAFHRIRELPALRRRAFEEIGSGTVVDGRGHYTIDDLLFELFEARLSQDSFRAIISVIREKVTAHIVEEERYLRSRMSHAQSRQGLARSALETSFKPGLAAKASGDSRTRPKLALVPKVTRSETSVEAN